MHIQHYTLTDECIQKAFEERQFTLVYQPIFNIKTHEITAAEAFIRWNHPVLGVVPPSLFFKRLAKAGYSFELSTYIIQEVINGCRLWREFGKDWKVHVNATFPELKEGVILEALKENLKNFERPEDIIIEIAPNIFDGLSVKPSPIAGVRVLDNALSDDEKIADIAALLKPYKDLGIVLALDATTDLQLNLPRAEAAGLSIIKVKSDLIQRALSGGTENYTDYILDALSQAKLKNITLIPVSIENLGQAKLVVKSGFTFAQGMFLAPPLQIQSFHNWQCDGLQEVERLLGICERSDLIKEDFANAAQTARKATMASRVKSAFGKRKEAS